MEKTGTGLEIVEMVARGEAPKKIKYGTISYYFDSDIHDYKDNTGDEINLLNFLNDAFEIIEEPILTDKERAYLKVVIEPFKSNEEPNPFKHKILSIKKIGWEQNLAYIEKIIIDIEDDDEMIFPIFQGNTMYKGMKRDKEYTLEELGLEK